MRVRKCRPEDLPRAVELARSLDLDYLGMEAGLLWVAEEAEQIVGLVSLKKHADCLELCALGVDPRLRGKGVGKALVEALVAETKADIHLATIIPEYFTTCGFAKTENVPESFFGRLRTAWCEGCDRIFCTVMVRKKS